MRVVVRGVVLSSLIASAWSSLALAQPAPAATPAQTQAASEYVEKGLAAQKRGDYDTALDFYQKAYDLVPHPTLIFNQAQAHRLAGHVEQAIALYRRYLDQAPSGPNAQTSREVLAELEAQPSRATGRKPEIARSPAATGARAPTVIAPSPATARAPSASASTGPAGQPVPADAGRIQARPGTSSEPAPNSTGASSPAPPAAPAPQTAAPVTSTSPTSVDERAADTGRTLRIAGLASGAVGAVSLGVGIGFAMHGRSLSNELSRPGAMYSRDKEDAGHRANTIATVSFITGGVAIAAGATLYYLGYARDGHERMAIAPMVSNGVTGVVLSGVL